MVSIGDLQVCVSRKPNYLHSKKRKKKSFCLIVILCFDFCPLILVLTQSTTEKTVVLSSLLLPFRHLYTLRRPSETSLFKAEQYQQSQPLFVDKHSCSFKIFWASAELIPVCPHFSPSGDPSTGDCTPDLPHQCYGSTVVELLFLFCWQHTA